MPSQMMPFGEPSRRRHRCTEAQPLTLQWDTRRASPPRPALSPLRGSQPCSLRDRTRAAGVGGSLQQPEDGGGGPGWPCSPSHPPSHDPSVGAVTAPHSRDGISHLPLHKAEIECFYKTLTLPKFLTKHPLSYALSLSLEVQSRWEIY